MAWSIESGHSHRCPNGHTWYDSDGGPCCSPCEGCGDNYPFDEMEEIRGSWYCQDCAEAENAKCLDCLEADGDYKNGLCKTCWDAGYADYKMDQMKDDKLEAYHGE